MREISWPEYENKEANLFALIMDSRKERFYGENYHDVSCCLCGAEETITEEEVGQWDHGIENYECQECE